MTDCFVFTLTIIWRVYWLYSNYLQHEPVLHKDTTSIRSLQLSLIHYLPPKLPLVFSLPVEQGLGRAIKWQKEEGGSRERGAGRGCSSVRGNKWNSVGSKDLWRFGLVTSVRKVLVFVVFFEMKEGKKLHRRTPKRRARRGKTTNVHVQHLSTATALWKQTSTTQNRWLN